MFTFSSYNAGLGNNLRWHTDCVTTKRAQNFCINPRLTHVLWGNFEQYIMFLWSLFVRLIRFCARKLNNNFHFICCKCKNVVGMKTSKTKTLFALLTRIYSFKGLLNAFLKITYEWIFGTRSAILQPWHLLLYMYSQGYEFHQGWWDISD